jgi:hypothetical protein
MAAGCAALFVFADSEEFSLNFDDAKLSLSGAPSAARSRFVSSSHS